MTKRSFQEAQRVKPMGTDGITAIRKVLKEGAMKINEVLVDAFSAGSVIAVHDALNPANQEKFRSFCVAQAVEVSFKLLNRQGRTA